MLDVLIIGGGPTGINCAIAAHNSGLEYLVLEKGVLANSIFSFPANMQFFSTSKNLEIGDIPFISHSDKPTRREALEYYRRIYDYYDINIAFRKKVTDIRKLDSGFKVITDSAIYQARNIIVATGFYDNANLIHVKGEELPKVKHYYDEVHHYIDQDVLVIGGANSACDVALECYQKGARVTMVVRKPTLYQNVKYWILPNIENRIREGSIKAYFESQVKSISEDIVSISTPDGEIDIKNDYVLAMTGYSPNYSFLEKLGIAIDNDKFRTPIYDESSLESSIKDIYLAGVILGGLKTNKYFIENTRDHATKIINHINQKIDKTL